MRIALAQMSSGPDPAENLAQMGSYVDQAEETGAELVVFPEAAMCRFGVPLGPVAQPLDGWWADGVRELADSLEMGIIAGMFTPADGGRVYNTLLAVGTLFDVHYHKVYLFDAYGFAESRTVAPGSAPVVVQTGNFRVGLSTCYDIRFPGMYQLMADQGADLIVVAAAWGAGPGKVEQWELLARARALDSTTFIAACGQADPGHGGGKAPTGVGHSLVVSPTGVVLDHLGAEAGLLVVDLDVTAVATAREALPVLANRRW